MGKYSHVTRHLEMIESAPSIEEALEACHAMEKSMYDPEVVDYHYDETLRARSLYDDPMGADAGSLDLEGAVALLTYIHRANRWYGRDEAFLEALESGLLARVLRRIRELDGGER